MVYEEQLCGFKKVIGMISWGEDEGGGGGGESLECNSRLKKDELNFPCIYEDLRNYPPPPPHASQ